MLRHHNHLNSLTVCARLLLNNEYMSETKQPRKKSIINQWCEISFSYVTQIQIMCCNDYAWHCVVGSSVSGTLSRF
jgi:hypothetical protein